MDTYCAPLVPVLVFVLLCERLSLTIIKLMLLKLLTQDDSLNIDNSYSEHMVSQIYPTELQLSKANSI